MKSIQYKLLAVILPVLIIALISVAYINHNKAKEFLEAEFNEKTEQILTKAENDINNYFIQKVKEVETIAHTDLLQSLETDRIIPYMNREIERLEGFEMLLTSNLNGVATSHNGESFDVSDRAYFKDVISKNETVLSEPIISRATEQMIVTIATPIISNNATEGILIATIEIADILKLVNEYRIGEQGYAFLFGPSGVTIAHPDESLIMEANFFETENPGLKSIVSAAADGQTGSIIFSDSGVESYGYYTSIPSTNWGFVISAPVKEVTGNLSYLAMLSFVTAVVALGFSAVIVIIFAKRLVGPIQHLSALTSKVAAGDLTVSADSRSKDEVGKLSSNFDTMMRKILELLTKINNVSATVKASSDTLLTTSKETKEASEQVAVTMSELASGTTHIADSISDATDQMKTMLNTVQQISQYTDEVVDTSTHSKEAVQRGLTSAHNAINKIGDVNATVNETAAIIDKLDRQSKEIGNIINMITSIAEQTNLLALNASIEAARAGEHGKGFAVVAEEVRKLAAETGESADKISNLIKQTQQESKKAVLSIKEGAKVVDEGTEIVRRASDSFSEIASYVDNVLEKNKLIFHSVQQLEQFGTEISTSMESISAVTEQASAGAEEVSATTEQQAAAANQIAYDAENLAQLANELNEVMALFKTA